MLSNFIYATKKSLFEAELSKDNILPEAVVFIEDTREIWNHGTYFGINPSAFAEIQRAVAQLGTDKLDKTEASGLYALKTDVKTYSAGTGLSLDGNTFNHNDYVTSEGTAGTSNATSGNTIAIPYVTYNKQGHITGSGTHTHTITGFTNNEGTVTSITPGTGLTGTSSDAAITTTGTINLKTSGINEIGGIKVASVGTAASGANTTVNANKFAVHVDSNGLGYVAIPQYSNNSGDITEVIAGSGLTGGASSGAATLNVGAGTGISVTNDAVSVKLKNTTALTIDSAADTTTSGRVYPVAVDKSGYLAVNVPWKNDNTTQFTITASANDDDVVVLSGTNGTNATTYTASHAKTFGNTTAPYTAKYTSGNSTTSVSGYGASATIKIPQITVDEYGHVRAGADESVVITMPSAQTIPDSLKNPKALTFGSKSYDGSSAQTITAADLGLESALKFHGTSSTAITDGSTTQTVTLSNGSSHKAENGCVLFYGNKEFVWNGSSWEELGNEGDYKVKQTAVSSPSSSDGSTTAFVDAISQNTNGVITFTKKTVAFPTYKTLTINNSAGTAQVSFNGSENKSLTLTKAMVGLGNVDNTADKDKEVKYATNSGSLGGYAASKYLRNEIFPSNSSFDANNMNISMQVYTPSSDVGSNATAWNNFPIATAPAGGFGLLTIAEGRYKRQIFGAYNDNHLYVRSQNYSGGTTAWKDWNKIAFTTDIPTSLPANGGTATYATYLGNSTSNYSKSSLDTALAGKLKTDGSNTMTAPIKFSDGSVDYNAVGDGLALLYTSSANNAPNNSNYGRTLSVVNGSAGFQLGISPSYPTLYYRAKNTNWGDWKTIAFTDSDITGNASTATALTSSAGSATNPIYFSGGKPVACTYSLNKTVPANAVFTDTWRTIQCNDASIGSNTLNLKAGTNVSLSNSNGTITISSTNTTYSSKAAASGGTDVSLVTTGEKHTWNNKQNAISDLATIRSNATNGNTAYGWGNHASVGYVKSSGIVSGQVAIFDGTEGKIKNSGHTIATSVPAGAKFTDTTYSAGTGLSLSGTTFSANGTSIINALTEGASPATREDFIVAQYAGGGTTTTSYHRKKLSHIFAALNKSDITTALGYTPPTSDTNTWRPIYNGVDSTATDTSASANAVKTAYDKALSAYNLANGKTSNTGTVTSVATGAGLTGGTISTSGTIKCNLNSEASLGTIGTTSKLYAVGVDANGKLCVNVPWSDNNTHYTSKNIVGTSATATSNGAVTGTGGVFLNHLEESAVKSTHKIVGAGTVKVTSDGSGNITITGTDTNTDTHYTTGINAGASGATSNSAQTNPYITVKDNSTYRSQIRLVGGGGTTVKSDASGNITISSTSSTECNFTNAYKTKLDGIASGATKVTESTVTGWGFAKTDDIPDSINEATVAGWGFVKANNHTHDYLSTSGGNISGNLTVTGTVSSTGGFFHTSDETLKNFIGNVEVDFDKLAALPKKYFTWKDGDDSVQIGTSAQEVQKVYPEIVNTDDAGKLSVDYTKLSVIALSAIDKLNEKNKELEDRLHVIESLLSKLNIK